MNNVKLFVLHTNAWNYLTVYKKNELQHVQKRHLQNVSIHIQ